MSGKQTVVVILLALLAGLGGSWVFTSVTGRQNFRQTETNKESAYDRVMRTQTIRCGYTMWPPLLIKDSNTGALSGTIHDYVEALGEALHLKVVWTEEVGWGDFPAALGAGRIDAFCAGAWPTAARARQADFVIPTTYQGMYAYTRPDDHRFDNNIGAINDPSVTIATMDGEVSALIAASDFPKAKTIQLPSLASSSDALNNVAMGKADVTLTDPITAGQYDANNPGKIRRIPTKTPLRVLGNPLVIPQGEDKLRRMLDTATEELLASGQIEKIIVKYEQYPGTLLRAAPKYQTEH